MGGTPHWRRGYLSWLQAATRTSAAERERCAAIVERWNAAPTHDWSPAIATALKAGYRWLDVYCPGCWQAKPVDLASVDIHPQAGLTSLILMLRCRGRRSQEKAPTHVSPGLETCWSGPGGKGGRSSWYTTTPESR